MFIELPSLQLDLNFISDMLMLMPFIFGFQFGQEKQKSQLQTQTIPSSFLPQPATTTTRFVPNAAPGLGDFQALQGPGPGGFQRARFAAGQPLGPIAQAQLERGTGAFQRTGGQGGAGQFVTEQQTNPALQQLLQTLGAPEGVADPLQALTLAISGLATGQGGTIGPARQAKIDRTQALAQLNPALRGAVPTQAGITQAVLPQLEGFQQQDLQNLLQLASLLQPQVVSGQESTGRGINFGVSLAGAGG
jgi:hypothetical protein